MAHRFRKDQQVAGGCYCQSQAALGAGELRGGVAVRFRPTHIGEFTILERHDGIIHLHFEN